MMVGGSRGCVVLNQEGLSGVVRSHATHLLRCVSEEGYVTDRGSGGCCIMSIGVVRHWRQPCKAPSLDGLDLEFPRTVHTPVCLFGHPSTTGWSSGCVSDSSSGCVLVIV